MNVSLDKDVADFLKSKVSSGSTDDVNKLANDLLRSFNVPQLEVTPELEAWLLEAADEPDAPLTDKDFAGIRERASKRLSRKL